MNQARKLYGEDWVWVLRLSRKTLTEESYLPALGLNGRIMLNVKYMIGEYNWVHLCYNRKHWRDLTIPPMTF